MATATMATAASAAALLYYTLHRRSQCEEDHGENSKPTSSGRNQVLHRPLQAPATWFDTLSTLSETLRFTYSETLGKWPIGDLAFGVNFLLKKQGNLPVASIYAGEDSLQLKGPEITAELRHLLNLLTICWHFSKKPFPLFLKETGFSRDEVLLKEPKAGLLKPAFTILVDKSTECILLLIRGTHSIKDTLTAVTGAVVPFHHTVVSEGGIKDLVLGYAHCGMVAAACWIAKLACPCLSEALSRYPDYKIKVVGHSLGGGTAALLTYVLREKREFSTATCVAFAPAACMTWELAESSAHFVTSVINGADLVPTFSPASVDDLRSEVTASAWLNDLRNQVGKTRIISTFYRSASALGSRLPSIAKAKATVVGAGTYLRPVSNGTQVVMSRARSVAQAAWRHPSLQVSSWSCMGPRRRPTAISNAEIGNDRMETLMTKRDALLTLDSSVSESTTEIPLSMHVEGGECSCSDRTVPCVDSDDDGEDLMGNGRSEDRMTEEEMWQQLEHELFRQREEKADIENKIRDEKETVAEVAGMSTSENFVVGSTETHRFYPPGKIMHLVTLFPEKPMTEGPIDQSDDSDSEPISSKVGIFLTSRSLYGKLRLSKTMISDHFMPVYRRQLEQVISELEMDS